MHKKYRTGLKIPRFKLERGILKYVLHESKEEGTGKWTNAELLVASGWHSLQALRKTGDWDQLSFPQLKHQLVAYIENH